MPRGRYAFGPGFWKAEGGWVPGSGGYRGGAGYGFGEHSPRGRWGPCSYFYGGYAPASPWAAEPSPEEEMRFLKEQAGFLQAELKEIEKRIAELQKEDKEQ